MMPGDDNSGIFVGFPDTGANTVDTSINQGEEIQIDPTDNPAQTTGAIYLEQAADAAARDAVLKPAGQWNAYEIVVREDRIIVFLNGAKINEWIDDDPNVDLATGHIGLQMHGAGDDVFFRNVRVRAARGERGRARHGRRHGAGDAVADAGRAGVVRDVHAQRGPDLRGHHDGHRDQHGG